MVAKIGPPPLGKVAETNPEPTNIPNTNQYASNKFQQTPAKTMDHTILPGPGEEFVKKSTTTQT